MEEIKQLKEACGIKIGDYIRTKDGVIAKVTYFDSIMIDCDRNVFDLENLAMMEIPIECKEEYILKYSSNIIDLIEERRLYNTRIQIT